MWANASRGYTNLSPLIRNPVITPVMFGARGDGSTNDYTALQASLDWVRTRGGTWYLPSGVWVHNTALDFGTSHGITYFGNGMTVRAENFSEAVGVNLTYPQFPSVLLYRGAANPAAQLTHNGSHCVFNNFSVWGALTSDADPPSTRPLRGMWLKQGVGYGAGKNQYNLAFAHHDDSFVAGTDSSSTNCDVLTFGFLEARYCNNAFKCLHDQGVGYVFRNVRVADAAEYCFNFIRGGGLEVSRIIGANIVGLLRVEGGGPTFGHYKLSGIQLDGDQEQRVRWFLHEPPTANLDFCNVIFDGGMGGSNGSGISQGDTSTPAFDIAGRCKLHVKNIINGMTNSWGNVIANDNDPSPLIRFDGTAARYCQAIFENCGLDDTDPTLTDWYQLAGAGVLRRRQLINCFRGSVNTPVDDIAVIE